MSQLCIRHIDVLHTTKTCRCPDIKVIIKSLMQLKSFEKHITSVLLTIRKVQQFEIISNKIPSQSLVKRQKHYSLKEYDLNWISLIYDILKHSKVITFNLFPLALVFLKGFKIPYTFIKCYHFFFHHFRSGITYLKIREKFFLNLRMLHSSFQWSVKLTFKT